MFLSALGRLISALLGLGMEGLLGAIFVLLAALTAGLMALRLALVTVFTVGFSAVGLNVVAAVFFTLSLGHLVIVS